MDQTSVRLDSKHLQKQILYGALHKVPLSAVAENQWTWHYSSKVGDRKKGIEALDMLYVGEG